jgi:hypothetical protein
MRRRVVLLLALVLGVGVLSGTGGASAGTSDAYSATKTLKRTFAVDGETLTVDERKVSVTVDHTRNLRGRERIRVSWTGAHPSGGRATNPYGENGMAQEYPVVVLQCRGLDDPTLPAKQRLSQETCWTSTQTQRSRSESERSAIWRQDVHASEEDRAAKSGMDPIPASCKDAAIFSTHLTPFVAADGTTFPACTSATMPPEAAADASFPPAEVAAFTDVEGKGSTGFEVRTAAENESLGCSSTVRCSLVVIPIMGISCDVEATSECTRTGRFAPGSSNYSAEGVDAAVSPLYWWAESNWRHRFSVPLTFATEPDVCDVQDSRAPTAFYGSELLSQTTTQWTPAYCLDADRFKLQHNRMGDGPAFTLMERGEAAAAFVSGKRERVRDAPVGYAPTALTGFAVSYVVDRPNNAGEAEKLRLTPRLLAKLLTQSYTGSALGAGHPGMGKNPTSLNRDPEFRALNPGLDDISREAAATVLSLSESSDVVSSLTAYIAQDPEARAFVQGKADPWGMVVNPSYRAVRIPTDEWPLLDTYVPRTSQECLKQVSTPYFTQIAAPVTSLRRIAEAVLDAWPNVQTKCTRSTTQEPWKQGRVDRQGLGSRFMLGIVSLGDAARLDLRTASLQTRVTKGSGSAFTSTAGRTFVAPTDSAIRAAVRTALPSKDGLEPFTLGPATTSRDPRAYPGTMVVYTAARLEGMAKAEARKVSQFITIATTEGQRRGAANGQLADGFVPLTRSGVTGALWRQAQSVAKAVAAQESGDDGTDGTDRSDSDDAPGAADAPGGAAPAAAEPAPAGAAAATGSTPTTTLETAPTAATTSSTGRLLLAGLLGLLLLAGLGAPVVRVVAMVRR